MSDGLFETDFGDVSAKSVYPFGDAVKQRDDFMFSEGICGSC